MTGYTSGKTHHDPKPWVCDSGERSQFGATPETQAHWGHGHDYEPRPEYDNHNPILVSFRKMQTLYPRQSINSRAWGYLSSLSSLGNALGASQDQITHARRVLAKLAAFTTTPNGVTD